MIIDQKGCICSSFTSFAGLLQVLGKLRRMLEVFNVGSMHACMQGIRCVLERLLSGKVALQQKLVIMDFQTSKNLGGVGALLLFIGPLFAYGHFLGGLLPLIGFILVLIALKSFADHYGDAGIFNNALYGFIACIVGVVVAVGVFVGTALTVIADLGITDWTNAAEWTALITAEAAFDALLTLLGGVVISLVVLFVFAILTGWLSRRSLGILASKSGVGLFGTAGMLVLVGAVLTIVLVGFILIWISVLLVAIAFFSMKPSAEPQP